jgi:hypothetical protein
LPLLYVYTDTSNDDNLDINDENGNGFKGDIDIKNQIQLFDGNVYPLEYYRQGLEEFNENNFDSEDYNNRPTMLLDSIEDDWNLCLIYSLSFHDDEDWNLLGS